MVRATPDPRLPSQLHRHATHGRDRLARMFCSVLQPSSIRGLTTRWTYFLHLSLSSVILIDSDCYYRRTITRFSIQTAGLAFGGTDLCSYRVRGVGGSCAEHLTVESYTIIISLQSYLLSYLLLLVFHHPLTLSL